MSCGCLAFHVSKVHMHEHTHIPYYHLHVGCRNELERICLEQLQFNINVPSSMYAKYYFDLRSLAEDNGLMFPNEYDPLTKERAKKLEVCDCSIVPLASK